MYWARYLAQESENVSTFHGFDIFMILFTIVIAWGVVRSILAKERNLFAIAFGTISLLVFLAADVVMVLIWMGLIGGEG